MVSNAKREAIFRNELDLIFNEGIREFTRLCLVAAPDYFFVDCPASTSGKYHPIDELGADGTILHTKKVATVAFDLCRGLACEDHRDEIISACIIHDLLKQGLTRTGHTTKSHPDLAARLVERVHEDTYILSNSSYKMIKNCVGFHYGPWSADPWKKDIKEYSKEELCVYLSDYIASKRTITVHYKREVS